MASYLVAKNMKSLMKMVVHAAEVVVAPSNLMLSKSKHFEKVSSEAGDMTNDN